MTFAMRQTNWIPYVILLFAAYALGLVATVVASRAILQVRPHRGAVRYELPVGVPGKAQQGNYDLVEC
jgi:hypothetical protein